MTFQLLLETLSTRLDTPIEDTGGAAALEIDGLPVILQDAGDLLLLRAEIADLPEENREPILLAILEANHLYRGTGGATLSLAPGTPPLHLQKYTWLDRLDPSDPPRPPHPLHLHRHHLAPPPRRLPPFLPRRRPPSSPDFLQVCPPHVGLRASCPRDS